MKYILSFFLAFFCGFLPAQTVEKTLATVEGEMISLMDLKETRKRLKTGFLEDSPLLTLFSKSTLKKKDSTLLEFLVYEKLLDLFAPKTEIGQNFFQKELSKRRKQMGLSKKAFSRKLVKNHFTSSSYKAFLKKSILRNLLIQKEIMEKIRISNQDLNEYALQKEGKTLFNTFEYELSYVLFPQTKEGKKQAQKNYLLFSKDPASFDKWAPEKKGEKKETLKKIQLSSMHPMIQKALKALSIGQISQVLSLPSGYHIFKALWKTPVITTKNKKRKEKLFTVLFKDLFKKELKNWLEQKKKTSFVQINK